MPAKNHYTLYKGYKLYYPLGHDLLLDAEGNYAVYVVMSEPGSSTIERHVVPGCFARSLGEAERLSIEHAKRRINEGSQGGLRARAPVMRKGGDEHAG